MGRDEDAADDDLDGERREDHLVEAVDDEADIALRVTNAPHETLVGRQLGLFEQALYARRSLVTRMQEEGRSDPTSWPWVDWDAAHRHHASAVWMRAEIAPAQVVARCDTAWTMHQLVAAGVGFTPTMLAAPDPNLVRVEPAEAFPLFHRGIWVLTHEDLRNVGRIRATVAWLAEIVRAEGGGVWRGVGPI